MVKKELPDYNRTAAAVDPLRIRSRSARPWSISDVAYDIFERVSQMRLGTADGSGEDVVDGREREVEFPGDHDERVAR